MRREVLHQHHDSSCPALSRESNALACCDQDGDCRVMPGHDDGKIFQGAHHETHLLSGLAVRAQGSHRRDRAWADRQDRAGPGRGRAGHRERRISAHHAAEETAGADPEQWRRHSRFLCHRRISQRDRRRLADPRLRPDALEGEDRSLLLQGMLDAMLLCRYEKMVRPGGCDGRPGPTTTGIAPGPAWRGSRRATTC